MTPINRDAVITASPERIRQTAMRAQALIKRIGERLNGIEENVRESSRFWQSESGETLRSYFTEDVGEYERLRESLTARAAALEEIAALYAAAEAQAAQEGEALPDTILA